MPLSKTKRKILNYFLGAIGVLILSASAILMSDAYEDSFFSWVETSPDRYELGDIQGRTRNKQDDYFFKIYCYYEVEGVEYSFYLDPGYSSREEAEFQAQSFEMPDIYTFWYKKEDPGTFSTEKPSIFLFGYMSLLKACGICLALVIGLLFIVNRKRATLDQLIIKQRYK